MNVRKVSSAFVAVAMVSLAEQASGQGFAGLGSDAQGFSIPERGRDLSFPADHGGQEW